MKLFILLCFISFSNLFVAADDDCDGQEDFKVCKLPVALKCKDSDCFCKNGTAFCRCRNDKDTWYLGENCDQEWTVVTFALVATLPGVCLAVIVGGIVQLAHYYDKKTAKGTKESKSSKDRQPQMALDEHVCNAPRENGSYSNMVFASDMQSRPRPPGRQPQQETIPMSRPHGYGAGMGQRAGNPYARPPVLRDPYEHRTPSPNHYDDSLRGDAGFPRAIGDAGFPRANLSPPSHAAPYQAAPYQAAPNQAAPYHAAPYQAAPYQAAPNHGSSYQIPHAQIPHSQIPHAQIPHAQIGRPY